MKKSFLGVIIICIVAILGLTIFASRVFAATTNSTLTTTSTETATNAEETVNTNSNNGAGLIAAALATGLACIGAGIAVAVVASAAVGAISEDPSLLGKTIIFAGLAEGIAIYGLIISIMILNKI